MIRTVNDAYLDLRAEFKRRGIAGYSLEARELVAFALGLGPEEFFEKRGQYIFEKDEAILSQGCLCRGETALRRRLRRDGGAHAPL